MYQLNDLMSKKRMKQIQDNLSDLNDSLEDMRERATAMKKRYDRVEFRKPWIYHRRWYEGGASLWVVSLLTAVLAAVIAYFMLRQPEETEYYPQGEGGEKWPEQPQESRPEAQPSAQESRPEQSQ